MAPGIVVVRITSVVSASHFCLLLILCWTTVTQAEEIKTNICVFEAPLKLSFNPLTMTASRDQCLSPLPNIFSVGELGDRPLWWHYGQLQNNEVFLQDFNLQLSDFLYQSGFLYIHYADGYVKKITLSPDSSDLYKTPYQQYQMSIAGRQVAVQDMYLGLDLRYSPSMVKLNVEAQAQSPKSDLMYWLVVGLVLGIQLAMLLYNFVLAVRFRFNFHITYCCLGAVALSYNFLLLGGDILLLPELNSNLALAFRYISIGFLFFFSVLFIVSFIETWALTRRLKYLAVGVASVGLLVAGFSFAVSFTSFSALAYNSYTMAAFNYTVAIETVLMIYLIVSSIYKGSRAGVFILLAWAPMILATIYRLGITSGVAELSLLTELSIPIASSLEMVILSLGIVDRLDSIRVERDEVTQANEKLLVATHTDPLTGAGNRRYLASRLLQAQASAEYKNADLALIIFDIDHFKLINDTWGHDAGDTVLVELVKQVKRISRSHEILARIGGEEFALLLPGANKNTASALAERVRLAVENIALLRIAPVDEAVTISLGVAVVKLNGADYQSLYRQADKALYAAKNAGRNAVMLFDDIVVELDAV